MATTLRSRHIRNSLAFYQTHKRRIVSAIGDGVTSFDSNDWSFLGATTTDPVGFTSTVVEAGSGTTEFDAANSEVPSGKITCAANENDGGSYQLLNESFTLSGSEDVYCGIKCQSNDADQTDLFFGLAITDTALLGGVTDGVYFESLDGSTSISFVCEKDSTETQNDSLGTLADDTDIILEFYWDGTEAEAFIDGSSVKADLSTNIPNDEALRLSLEYLTGEATANTLTVAWMRAFVFR